MKNSKRPRGRPRVKNPANEKLNIRVTPAEKRKYAKAADGTGKSLSAWIKELADRNS